MIFGAAWKKYFAEQDKIRAELKKFITNHLLPEFYSDPWFWASMNDRWNDKNAYIFILLAKYYNPTLLGGEKATKDWIDANSATIKEIAKESWDSTKPKAGGSDEFGDMNADSFLMDLYKRLIPDESQRRALETYYAAHPAELRALLMDQSKLINFLQNVRTTGTLKGGVQ